MKKIVHNNKKNPYNLTVLNPIYFDSKRRIVQSLSNFTIAQLMHTKKDISKNF